MRFARLKGLIAVLSAILSMAALSSAARAADTLLADWETAPGPVQGADFDPTLDNTVTCSGCWISNKSSVTYSQSTGAIGATHGTHALQADIIGKGNGGSYSPTINGSPVLLQTHFDNPLTATYSSQPGANGGVVDPRFTAIKAAVDGNQALYTVDFDITYDVTEMRSIPWQPPIETVNPDPNNGGAYPQRFFWVGMGGNANDPDGSGFQFVGFDANNINAFDPQWDNNLHPVFHASFPLTLFGFEPQSALTAGQTPTTFYSFSFLYNSVFGTSPASSNTSAVHIYFDNLVLKQFVPASVIDYNNNGVADTGDWNLFMAQYLKSTPPTPPNPNTSFDLIGNFGAIGTNGVVDFADLQRFQQLYHAANPGAGALSAVPEPGSFALAALALVGVVVSRARRFVRPMMTLAVGLVLTFTHQAAQAQLLEGYETIGKWATNPGAVAGTNPVVTVSSTGVTQGTKSLKVTQTDSIPPGNFSWNAATSPTNWVAGDTAFEALKAAVRIGAEHYNLLVDTTFNVADLPAVNSLTVTLGLNFNGQTIATYDATAPPSAPITATIPLSNFNLPDTVDQGVNNYSGQIGITLTSGDVDPFSVYIDNIRLVKISDPDLLTLQIDRSTGAATLKNTTANPIAWNFLDIKSAGGSLSTSGWSSLADQNADGAGTWVEAGGSSATELAEASLLGSHTLAPNTSLSLGNLWNNGIHTEDVGFVIRKAAGPTNRTYDQNVVYINALPGGVPGDYNNNGIVDAADYTTWRDHLGQTFALQNRDSTASGAISQADYTFWKNHFGQHAGSGALSGGAVPEPSTFVLCLSAVAAMWAGRRTRIV